MLSKKPIPCPRCSGRNKKCTFCNGTGKVFMVEDDGLDTFNDISFAEAFKTVGNQILKEG